MSMKDWARDYCVLEIVTTGHDPETALPVEAGAIRVEGGAEAARFHAFIDAGVPVPACVRERSGRGEEEYLAGEEAGAALARLADFLGRGPVLAHGGAEMEAAVLQRFAATPHGPLLDTQELAWLVTPYLRDHSRAALADALLGEEPGARALEDARLLQRLLLAMRRAWEEAPRRLRAAVSAALAEAGSPWSYFLPREGGEAAFPDLTHMLPRHEWPAGKDLAGGPRAGAPRDGTGAAHEVAALLAPGGGLASLMPDHEPRPQQAAMAEAVARALEERALLVVEAGTGVGKSLAYLLPGALRARSTGMPLVVSTYTRNLQEQLFHRDLPLLARALGGLDFALLKGRGNYICLRKWSEWCAALARGEPVMHFGEHPPALSYALLVSWLMRTASGDLEEIALGARSLLGELPRELASASEDCLRSRCPLRARCWVEKARGAASASEVVVVNHALLLSQMTGEGEMEGEGASNLVLPEFASLVLDEAHHLEDVATDALSLVFSLEDCLRVLEDAAGRRGVTARWAPLPLGPQGQGMLGEAQELAESAGRRAEELCLRLLSPLLEEAGKGGGEETKRRLDRALLAHPAWERARERGGDLAADLSRLADVLGELCALALPLEERDDVEAAAAARKAEALAGRLREASAALQVFTREPDGELFREHLRWMERGRGAGRAREGDSLALVSAPVNVGGALRSLLFAPLESCVLTSASLRVPGAREGFHFFLSRSGLGELEEEGRDLRLLALDSPFDYARQVRLLAVSDLPEPRAGGEAFQRYMRDISGVVEEALLATGGKALVLLTSHQQVDFLHAALRPRLEARGLCCLRQRRGMPNALLLERFRADRDSVLFATEAFWEGVDVPGESLSAVIMVKLPFRHPRDPVVEGRVEHLDAAGVGGWSSYYLPLALTLFRQGIGRLLRRSSDRGIIVMLDPRFLNRPYARLFHAALPPGLRVERVRAGELREAVRARFEADPARRPRP